MKVFCKKRIAVLCVVCLIVCMVSGFTSPSAGADNAAKSSPGASASKGTAVSAVPVYINGIKYFDGTCVGDTVYIALSDFYDTVGIQQTDIAFDGAAGTAVVTAPGLSLTAVVGEKYVTANDRCFYVPEGVQLLAGKIAAPLRVLAVTLQYSVEWDKTTDSVSLVADEPSPLVPASAHYNEQDLYWLSHLINAEAGNQPIEGKIAVGDVVLNRVADPSCPDTVHDVVFDNRFGTQFSVTTAGGIYAQPNDESIVAAKACLEGASVVGNALFFVNPKLAAAGWFDKTRTFIATIGEHDFYA